MNGTQRIKAMLSGEKVDRPGISAWKHFYLEDRHPVDFVKRTMEFQDSNDWDFIKVMFNGYLMPEAFGAEIEWSKDSDTFPTMIKHPLNCPIDFANLTVPDVTKGAFKREVEAVEKLVKKYKGKVPVIPTIFTPLTAAEEMYSGWLNPYPTMAMVEHYPEELHKGLEVICQTILNFLDELVKVGIDGIFLATHLSCGTRLTREQHKEFTTDYALRILNHIKDNTWFNMLHVHGIDDLYIKEIKDYPVQAVNWEDVQSNVSLKEAREMMPDKILIAGIEQWGDFYEEDRQKLKEHLKMRCKNAVEQIGRDKFIMAPGCCVPTDVPEYRLTVFKEACEEFFGEFEGK
ncbi:MAG: hypothetical protein N4A68_20080 [Maledivibacter sp.]|jgi:uroporphyrinogen decarboxylase|nr:hypothetical protein [Maledivibacter sp.]